jgi:O-antigen ligase
VSVGARLREYQAALGLWRLFPVSGTGLGTFRDAFPLVQPPDLRGTWWHPHSDLLEVLVTGGLLGAALLVLGGWSAARRLAAVHRQGGRSEDRAAALAALGALVSLGLHESWDFGLTMPGNAVTFAALLGAATLARTRERSAQRDGAGQDLAAVEAVELEDVEAGPDRHPAEKRRRRSHQGPDRKHAHGGAVEP